MLVSQWFPFVQDEQEQGLSTHEKERLKMCTKIEQMEKANLEPSTWTMQGEVLKIMHFILPLCFNIALLPFDDNLHFK